MGTYAWELSRHWPGDKSRARFLDYSDAAASQSILQNAEITSLHSHASRFAKLLEDQQCDDVLLHYAGRAYHRYGFPFWMPKAFDHWRRSNPRRRLHVMFHELPADLPLLSKQGIIQRLSFVVARRLAEEAATLFTNSKHHASVLRRWSNGGPVHWFPVPSNIPAPEAIGAAPQRTRGEFVIFGLPYTRFQTLRMFEKWIAAWRRSGRLRKLHLIGPRDEKFAPQADHLLVKLLERPDIVHHGELSASEVSKQLAGVECCLSNSTDRTWSKSGTLMAYAAHGCAVITQDASAHPPLNLTIAATAIESASEADVLEKGEQLRQWYEANATWELTAKRIADLIVPPSA